MPSLRWPVTSPLTYRQCSGTWIGVVTVEKPWPRAGTPKTPPPSRERNTSDRNRIRSEGNMCGSLYDGDDARGLAARFRRRRSMPPAARPARAMAIVEGSGTGTIRVLSKPP